MPELKIDFVWRRSTSYEFRAGRFFPNGQEFEHRPLDYHPTLYKQFADLQDEPGKIIEFLESFGTLTHNGRYNGELYNHILNRREQMRMWIEQWQKLPHLLLKYSTVSMSQRQAFESSQEAERISRKNKIPISEFDDHFTLISNVKSVLRPGPGGKLTRHLVPDTLWDAIVLQFQQKVSTDTKLLACPQCGTWFEAGPEGRRSVAKFCSDNCRINAHKKARASK